MKKILQSAVAAASLLPLAFTASAATQQDVSKARAECATHKAKVLSMESRSGKGAGGLAQAKVEWEAACQQAEILINEMSGTRPPQVVPQTRT